MLDQLADLQNKVESCLHNYIEKQIYVLLTLLNHSWTQEQMLAEANRALGMKVTLYHHNPWSLSHSKQIWLYYYSIPLASF